MNLIKEIECDDIESANHEGELIREYKSKDDLICVNILIAGRTKKEYFIEYKIKNKDILKIKRKEYKLNNKEKIKEQNKEYRLNNKEEIKDKSIEYYENNKEQINKNSKEYYEKNKEKLNKRRREGIQCPQCNKEMCRDSLSKHIKLLHSNEKD